MTIRHYAYAAGIATSLVLFAACGDDVTEVTKVSETASLDQVKKFKELPKCEEDIEGTLVYVKDSAKVFGCTSDGWVRFNGLDGADGKNGSKGKDGDDGMSCTAKQNKKKTGFDIVCDGKTVASIENGSDGKKGSDGDEGVSCTAKQNKKKTGVDVTCGDKTVTIPNGIDGADGAGCTFTDGENGAVMVICGEGDDADSLTLFKAVCGKSSFDPETQFCYKDDDGAFFVGDRCKYRSQARVRSEGVEDEPEDFSDEVYDPQSFFCDANDTLRLKCKVRQDDGVITYVAYDYEKEYCDYSSDKIRALAYCVKGDKKSPKYKPEYQYCYKTKLAKGIQVADMDTCGADHRYFNPRTEYCTLKSSGNGYINGTKICTETDDEVDSLDIDVRYTGEDDFRGRGSICDTRNYQVYKYTTIRRGGKDYVWMAQNLNYTDAHTSRRTAKGEFRLDSTSFCYDNDSANCDKYGRLYTWAAAIDSIALDSGRNALTCGYGVEPCDKPKYIQGVCPDGWHLPIRAEVTAITMNTGSSDNLDPAAFMVNDKASYAAGVALEDLEWKITRYLGNDSLGFAALPSGDGRFRKVDGELTWTYQFIREAMPIWTSVDVNAEEALIWHLDYDSYYMPAQSNVAKYFAFAVRCVRGSADDLNMN